MSMQRTWDGLLVVLLKLKTEGDKQYERDTNVPFQINWWFFTQCSMYISTYEYYQVVIYFHAARTCCLYYAWVFIRWGCEVGNPCLFKVCWFVFTLRHVWYCCHKQETSTWGRTNPFLINEVPQRRQCHDSHTAHKECSAYVEQTGTFILINLIH